jgi:hypothetical protein
MNSNSRCNAISRRSWPRRGTQNFMLPEDRGGVLRKGDTTKTSGSVNSPFTMEELVDMINVSVSSKYGADLQGMTCTLMDSLHGSVESFKAECKQDSENALSRQVRATIQPVLGEVRDTHDTDVASASMTAPGRSLPLVQRLPHPSVGRVANLNLPQPYYQTSSYGTHAPAVPDAYFA